MSLTGPISTARSTMRQQSRGRAAADARAARTNARNGTGGTAKLVEPTGFAPVPALWPQFVMVTHATPREEKGKYDAHLFHYTPDAEAGGNLDEEQIGETGDEEVELWHAPDMAMDAWTLREDDVVMAYWGPSNPAENGKPIVISLPNEIPAAIFMVRLTTDGGEGGSRDSAPDFTYTMRALAGGEPIREEASPLAGRPGAGKYFSASYGLAFFDRAAEKVELLCAFESADTTFCEPEEDE